MGTHFFYIVAILVGIIILLATGSIATNQEAVAYISFAATLSSLILAILAIIYSIVSNTSITTALTSINKSSDEIEKASSDVIRSVSELEELSASLSDSSKKVQENVAVIPSYLNAFKDEVSNNFESQLAQGHNELRCHIDSKLHVIEKLKDNDQFISQKSAKGEEVDKKTLVQQLVKNSSMVVLDSLLIICFSNKYQKEITFGQSNMEIIEIGFFSGFYGTLTTCRSLRLLKSKTTSGNNDELSILVTEFEYLELEDVIGAYIKRVESYLTKEDKKKARYDNEDFLRLVYNDIEDICNYFGADNFLAKLPYFSQS